MVNLDKMDLIKKYDKSDMLKLIESFPQQCRDAKSIGQKFDLAESFKIGYENVVCTGLGGSAIGADIVRSYIADEAAVPVLVNRNYTLPRFVGPGTLVIASSYSGNTEETLGAYKDARSKKAKIIAITSGGELQKMAERDGNPAIIIPGGLPPRCALGYSSFTLLVLLSKIGLVGDKSGEIDETVEVLAGLNDKKIGARVPLKDNPAKRVADELYLKFPVIYGGQDHIDSVVTRWRGQIAENSKCLASSHVFPEMNHNEIVGWEHPEKLLKDFAVVLLRDAGDHPRTSIRMDISKEIIGKAASRVIEVCSCGKGLLARIFSLIYIGDFTSFYLAILNETDPTPVDRVTYLKGELAKK